MKKTLFIILCLAVVCITLCACIGSDSDSVTFSFIADGEEVYSALAGNGDLPELPSEPTKSGCVFIGWYLDDGVWEKPMTKENIKAVAEDKISVYAYFRTQFDIDVERCINAENRYLSSPFNVKKLSAKSVDLSVSYSRLQSVDLFMASVYISATIKTNTQSVMQFEGYVDATCKIVRETSENSIDAIEYAEPGGVSCYADKTNRKLVKLNQNDVDQYAIKPLSETGEWTKKLFDGVNRDALRYDIEGENGSVYFVKEDNKLIGIISEITQTLGINTQFQYTDLTISDSIPESSELYPVKGYEKDLTHFARFEVDTAVASGSIYPKLIITLYVFEYIQSATNLSEGDYVYAKLDPSGAAIAYIIASVTEEGGTEKYILRTPHSGKSDNVSYTREVIVGANGVIAQEAEMLS